MNELHLRLFISVRCSPSVTRGVLQIQDRSPQLRSVTSECVCDWLSDATGLGLSSSHCSPSDHFPVFTRLSINPKPLPPPTLHFCHRLHSLDIGSFLTDLKSSRLIIHPPKSLGSSGVFRGGHWAKPPPPLALASRRQKGDAGACQHNITK